MEPPIARILHRREHVGSDSTSCGRGRNGTLIFGLIPYQDTRYPQPVYRTSVPITDGKAEINIKTSITARYDTVGWTKLCGSTPRVGTSPA
jgi:hypothetical protein